MIGTIMLLVALISIGTAIRAAALEYPEQPDSQWAVRMKLLAARRAEIERMQSSFEQLQAMEAWLAEFDQLNRDPARLNHSTGLSNNIVILHRQL